MTEVKTAVQPNSKDIVAADVDAADVDALIE